MIKWIILGICVFIIVFIILPLFIFAFCVYRVLLVRTNSAKWRREFPKKQDAEYRGMYVEGNAWAKQFESNCIQVSINSEGYRLEGEYFDFNSKSAVIIIPGRTESLLYSYYFAEPYRRAGYNILVIDNRCHGNSEGKYVSLGQKEYKDILAWSQFLHDTYGNHQIVMHGICIGSSCALYAFTQGETPPYLSGMVAEGMYITFFEIFKNHVLKGKLPKFLFTYIVMLYIRLFGGVDARKDGPIYQIGRMYKPIMFLQSKKDVYSLPEKAKELYAHCGSKFKRIVWFENGAHSRIRPNNKEAYDQAVYDFACELRKL